MIKVVVLPDNVVVEVDKPRVKVKELLKIVGEDSLENVAVLVNDRLLEDEEREVSSDDRVVVIKQPIGG